MRSHFRVLSVLLALFAFSASVAEGVWASTCAAMEMRAGSAGGMTAPMEGMGGEHSPDVPHRGEAPGDERDCPLPTLAGSGCIVVSLHSATIQVDLTTPEDSAAPLARSELSDRLAVSTLFRPPQR
jgi:hypothetical protein